MFAMVEGSRFSAALYYVHVRMSMQLRARVVKETVNRHYVYVAAFLYISCVRVTSPSWQSCLCCEPVGCRMN